MPFFQQVNDRWFGRWLGVSPQQQNALPPPPPPVIPVSGTLLAIACVDALNAESWSLPFVAERVYLARRDLPDLASTRVSVLFAGVVTQNLTRSSVMRDYTLLVGLQKKMAIVVHEDAAIQHAKDCLAADPLADLAEEIMKFLEDTPLLGCAPLGVEIDPPYNPEAFNVRSEYEVVLKITYRWLP